MENASKALYIAGSLLIALLVISLLVYTFNNLGGVEEQKDEIAYEESITAFNREYEAFNKKIMYGVDVISCINKAVSNNEKYVKEINGKYGSWASGGASGEEAVIDIQVLLKNDLKESFQIYHMNDKHKESKLYKSSVDNVIKDFQNNAYFGNKVKTFFDITNTDILTVVEDKTIQDVFGNASNFVTFKEFTLGLEEMAKQNTSRIDGKTYYTMDLLDISKRGVVSVIENSPQSLSNLVARATELEIVKVNDVSDSKVWSSIKWTTVLADFKKRKFECYEINYNEDTGRIDNIIFKEK